MNLSCANESAAGGWSGPEFQSPFGFDGSGVGGGFRAWEGSSHSSLAPQSSGSVAITAMVPLIGSLGLSLCFSYLSSSLRMGDTRKGSSDPSALPAGRERDPFVTGPDFGGR